MFTSLIAAVVALPFFASATVPSNCARTYKVVEGDTCDGISAARNASTYQLSAINPDINVGCSNLAIDQVICLGTVGEDCTSTYIVKPDDTCDVVTNIIGVNATILYANNPQIVSDCSNIYVGEVLCSASEVTVPPAPASRPTSPVLVAPGTAVAAPSPHQTPAGEEDIPECEDPNDNGEW